MEREIQKIASKELFSMIEELLAEGRQAAFTVTGMSMWPFLCHGSRRTAGSFYCNRDEYVAVPLPRQGSGCG